MSDLAEIGANPDLKSLVDNPKVTNAQVVDTLYALLKIEISDEAKSFIELLAENGRILLLPEIGEQFFALKNADEGSADAFIYSAYQLDDAQVQELASALSKKFGRTLMPTVEVDESLIGGVRVVVGDEVLDTSVRAKLQQMRDALVS